MDERHDINMKTLVVYYSLSGNTKWIAEQIANAVHADLCPIKTKRSYPKMRWMQMVVCGAGTVFKTKPRICMPTLDLAQYDTIFLGTPVWAGTYAAPINTFLHQYPLNNKNIAVFASCAGEEADKCFLNLKASLEGNRILGESAYRDPLRRDKEQQAQSAMEWAKRLME